MKKSSQIKFAVLGALAVAGSAFGSVSIGISGGALFDSGGTPLVDGTLVYAVSSDSASFPIVTGDATGLFKNDFTFGDNVLLGSWVIDSGVAGPGTFDAFLPGLTAAASGAGLSVGDRFAIIWVAGLTGASTVNNSAALTQGLSYGVYTDPSWVIPADGSTSSFSVETAFIGGSVSNNLTKASLVVSPAVAVPEPSSFAALAGFAVLGLAVSRRRRA